jgi:hypothetical protein
MLSVAAAYKSRVTEPRYNPTGIRRCATCGRRDAWRRLVDDFNPGGWACCTPGPAALPAPEMHHACSTLCGLGGVS